MVPLNELYYLSATALAKLVRTRQVSSVELTQAFLSRIERHNPALNAIVTLDAAGALTRARAADAALARGEATGPLHGVPMTLKDSHSTAGMRTVAGDELRANYVPAQDSTVAARLKAAGAILLGKTNVSRLTFDWQTDNAVFGRTVNPWNPERTPGGSSGGASAALAAGLTPLEIGTDLGGSVRWPSHCCGTFGLKPTERRVPLTGHIPDWPGGIRYTRIVNTIGPMARSVDDLALALRIIAGPDGIDSEVPPVPLAGAEAPPLKELRVAWAPRFPGWTLAADVSGVVRHVAERLAGEGALVHEALPPIDFQALIQSAYRLSGARYAIPHPPAEERPVLLADYLMVLHERDRWIAAWERFFDDWDVLLCPIAATVAFPHCKIGEPVEVDGVPIDYDRIFDHCVTFNFTGHPAVVLPAGAGRDGMPVGVQLVGRRWGEERLLAIAAQVAELTGPFRRPHGF